MKFEEWEPHYRRILDFFGFDPSADEDAADYVSALCVRDDLELLEELCRNKTVTICGNAPCLKDEIGLIKGTIIAADAAADFLYSKGIRPDAVFTDLDGCEESFIDMNTLGTIMVVHAHGDNIPLLKKWIPFFKGPVVLTTQARPLKNVHNFGGFTDGDRAVFAAKELGASEILILGFDLDDPGVNPMKRGKLMIARDLLKEIGYDL
ncbi:MAG: DUF115 domain-containing protein [Methanomicrobiaceae archaeon]|nr:DUF115 domain-containing protein [Methanomicrobiaceae archaeon]